MGSAIRWSHPERTVYLTSTGLMVWKDKWNLTYLQARLRQKIRPHWYLDIDTRMSDGVERLYVA